MNLNSNAVGLSARQGINFHFGNYFWVLLILLVLLLASVVRANGQALELKKAPPKNNEPKVDIKVSRHYDNHGNVIGYDSTYSSYYSNVQGDTMRMHSLMKNFDRYFGEIRTPFFDKLFDNRVFNDTIMAPNCLRKDFFGNDLFLNHGSWPKLFDDMNHQLDSLKNGLYDTHKPRYRL